MHCNLLKVNWLLCTTFALCCLKITLRDIKTLFTTMYNRTVFNIYPNLQLMVNKVSLPIFYHSHKIILNAEQKSLTESYIDFIRLSAGKIISQNF